MKKKCIGRDRVTVDHGPEGVFLLNRLGTALNDWAGYRLHSRSAVLRYAIRRLAAATLLPDVVAEGERMRRTRGNHER